MDNVATGVTVMNGSSAGARHHNLLRQNAVAGDLLGTPAFAGGASPTSFAGYALVAGSPGKHAASDGADIGINPSSPEPARRTADPPPAS